MADTEFFPGDTITITLGLEGEQESAWKLIVRRNNTDDNMQLWRAEPLTVEHAFANQVLFRPQDVTKVERGWRAGQRRRVLATRAYPGFEGIVSPPPSGYATPPPAGAWVITRADGCQLWAMESEPSELLSEATQSPAPEKWHGWRPGQRVRVWTENGTVVGYLRQTGNEDPDDWMVDEELNQRLGVSTYVGASSVHSQLLKEAPAPSPNSIVERGGRKYTAGELEEVPAGQTTEGGKIATLRAKADAAMKRYMALVDETVKLAAKIYEDHGYQYQASHDDRVSPACDAAAARAVADLLGEVTMVPVTFVIPPPEPLREVSPNGRDWVDYASLTDADPFESYGRRRVNGEAQGLPTFLVCAQPYRPCPNPATLRHLKGFNELLCDKHFLVNDGWDRGLTDNRDESAAARDRLVAMDRNTKSRCTDAKPVGAYPQLFGGIWRTR